MPYVKKTVSYGNYIDFEFYHTKRQLNSLPEVRRPKFKETTAAQQEVNRRNAVVNLRRLICCNFVRDDLHLQLKYIRKSGEPYRTEDEMRKDIAFFHRKMRAEYRKKGIDYKYIRKCMYLTTARLSFEQFRFLCIRKQTQKTLTQVLKITLPTSGVISV